MQDAVFRTEHQFPAPLEIPNMVVLDGLKLNEHDRCEFLPWPHYVLGIAPIRIHETAHTVGEVRLGYLEN